MIFSLFILFCAGLPLSICDLSSDRSVLSSLCTLSFFPVPCDWTIDPCRWPWLACDRASGEVTSVIVLGGSRAVTLPSLAGMRSLTQLTVPSSALAGDVVLEIGPSLAAVDLSFSVRMRRLTLSVPGDATPVLGTLVLRQGAALESLDGLCAASRSLSALLVEGSSALAAFDGRGVLGCVLPKLRGADFSFTALTAFPLVREPHPTLLSLRMRFVPLAYAHPLGSNRTDFDAFPNNIADIAPNLYELDVAGSNLRYLPSSLHRLRLNSFDVSANNLVALKPLPDPAILTYLDFSNCYLAIPLNRSNLGLTSPNVVLTLRMSSVLSYPDDDEDLGRLDLTLFTHLVSLEASMNPWIVTSPLLHEHAPLQRVDLNGCSIQGPLSLPCSSTLRTLNIQNNLITTVRNSTAAAAAAAAAAAGMRCWASLSLVNAASNALEDVEMLAGAVMWNSLVMVDLSDNPRLGLALVDMYPPDGGDKSLRSLRLAGTGLSLDIADILAAMVARFMGLTELDLARNPNITGVITEEALRASGAIPVMTRTPPAFPFMVLTLDFTSIAYVDYTEVFPFLTELSMRSVPTLSQVFALTWTNLRKLDLRGNFANAIAPVTFSGDMNPAIFPNTQMILDTTSGALCPEELRGGDLSFFAVRVDPQTYGYRLCRCPQGTYPAFQRCIPCPDISDADRGLGLSVSCGEGTVTVRGGVLRRNPRDASVLIPTLCPSLVSAENPCESTSLDVYRSAVPTVTCAPGHTGRLCSGCLPGFFRLAGRCAPCSAAAAGAGGRSGRSGSLAAWMLPALTVLVATAVGTKVQLGGASARSGLVRTLSSHAATLGLLPNMKLSEGLSSLMIGSSAGSASLRFEGLECLGVRGWNHLWGPFALAASLPAVAVLGSLWITAVAAAAARLFGLPPLSLRAGFARGVAWVWLALLATSVCSLLVPANCVEVGGAAVDAVDDEGGVADSLSGSFVASDLTVACTAKHWRAAGAGVAVAVLYSLGSLVATARLTLRRGVGAPSLGAEGPGGHLPAAPPAASVSSFLRSPFRADSLVCGSWELALSARRLVVAVLAAMGPGRGVGSPAAISLVLLVSVTCQAALAPFRLPLDNRAELSSLVLLLFTYISALLTASPQFKGSLGATALLGGLVATNIAFLAVLLAAIAGKAVLRRKGGRGGRPATGADDGSGGVGMEQALLTEGGVNEVGLSEVGLNEVGLNERRN